MPTVIVSLQDLARTPGQSTDWVTMSETDAIAAIKKLHGFLSSAIDVSIRDGVAYITLPDVESTRVDEALKSIERAETRAKDGDYKRAIQLFERALLVVPNHTQARRNLAMAYLELGDKDKAKDLLIQVLALDPKDEWAFVLLGNIYSKHEKNLDQAEKFYRRAFELDPRDAVLLTNYGALMVEKGFREQAAEFFERAIQAQPSFPNSYYALALIHLQNTQPDLALAQLDAMFAHAQPMDSRSSPLYAQARQLYFELNQRVAEQTATQAMELVESRRKELETETGYTIRIQPDPSLEGIFAITQMAWRYDRDYHLIRYRDTGRGMNPHHLMHELEHIQLEHQARQANQNRNFVSTPQTRERAIRSIGDWIFKMRQSSYTEDALSNITLKLVDGLANQLFNCPLDMVIERRVYENYPLIRPSQFVSVQSTFSDGVKAFAHKDIKRIAPPHIYKSSIALNCAFALFLDSLYENKTEYARAYESADALKIGQRLFHLYQDAFLNLKPGDEYALVDEFARVLKLENWFEWKTDNPSDEPDASPQGATNLEILRAMKPAIVLFLVNALERFAKLSEDEVRQIGLEIGVRGMEGIDYASPDQTHTLKAFPGEKFSGLQMLCLMYVAFQHIDPTADIGADLSDAYQTALKMFKGRDLRGLQDLEGLGE